MPVVSYLHIPLLSAISLISLSYVFAAQTDSPNKANEPAMIFHVEAREAVIDVVAHDHQGAPVADMRPEEFQVYEVAEHGNKITRPVRSLSIVDPEQRTGDEGPKNRFRVSSGAVCALNAAVHYQIAILSSPHPGYHALQIKATRAHVDLTYRRQYYVGFTTESVTPRDLKKLVTPEALQEAACYHPLTTPTLAMTARVLDVTGGTATRFAAIIKPESLSLVGFSDTRSSLQLDFGMCIFDAHGEVTSYLHSSSDRVVDEAERSRILEHGLVNLLDIPGNAPPVLARLAVLDRMTGNLGIVDIARPLSVPQQLEEEKKRASLTGDIRGFGSVTPSENAFCGDVYELPVRSTSLTGFRDLDPVASLYANTLDVPNQNIMRMGGIPGITHSSLWFGIDYYGKFYVSKRGDYVFELESDDGARLEIDNKRLIDLDGVHHVIGDRAKVVLSVGWHSIHVPYFQGPPTSLALILRIQPPGESMRTFNLNEFIPAAE